MADALIFHLEQWGTVQCHCQESGHLSKWPKLCKVELKNACHIQLGWQEISENYRFKFILGWTERVWRYILFPIFDTRLLVFSIHCFYKTPRSVWKDAAPVFFGARWSQNKNPGNRLTVWRDNTNWVSPFLECKQMRTLWLAQFTELYPCSQEMKIFPLLWGCRVQKSFHLNSVWHSLKFYLHGIYLLLHHRHSLELLYLQ